MAKITFALSYTKTKATPPAGAADYEKSFPTLEAALDFCSQLTTLGGEALYIIKYIYGTEASVLEGDDLALAIKTYRPGRNAA
jgi:hypothetical protein